MSASRPPADLGVLWVGPFPVPFNGISRDFTKIRPHFEGKISLSSARLHFSDWQRDYPLQLGKALLGIVRAARQTPRPLLHLQYCPFSTGPGSLAVVALARALGLTVITTVHEDQRSVKRRRIYWRVYPALERLIFRLSDAFIVHSEVQRRSFGRRMRERARVIEFGIEPCACRRRPVLQPPTVGCFGLIAHQKGLETVIEACARLAERLPDLRLLIAGATPGQREREFADAIEAVAVARLGDRVSIVRGSSEAEFEQLIHSVDVACFGMRHLTQSGTFFRVLGHGKPVVATDIGGVGEIVGREGMGKTVPVDDPAAMAEALAALLGNPAAYASAQAAVSAYAVNRSWAANAAEHLALYRSLAGSAAVTPAGVDQVAA
jgi:glycosyltransferase involved in cell wall biosynthesis